MRFLLVVTMLLAPVLLLGQANPEIADPVLRKLVQKGLLTVEEAREASDQQRLIAILVRKGIFTADDAKEMSPASPAPVLMASTEPSRIGPVAALTRPAAPDSATPATVQAVRAASTTQPPAAPAVVPAVAPLRVLPIDPVKREGLIPDIKLGSGARIKPYGFVKSSLIHDTSSPSGTDMPLPYLNADTGPTVDPEFHARARNMRIGTQFEWLDSSPKWALTGRFEADFEGSFTRALNRNISSVRSSQFSIRLAWGRLDRLVSDKTDVFVLFGQDWTPFGSSTLPNIVETTGLGLGYGTLYERLPQARFGVTRTIGGSRNLKISPEVAVVMPAFGNTPANVADQLGYGERQGADSGRPEMQGRLVTQWQLDKAPAVAPAQFIVSWVQASRKALVRTADVPAAFKSAFPSGAEISSDRWGYTIELQLPTRWFTWQGKWFQGKDLRFYFVGGLYSNYNDTFGLTGLATAPSIDGASTVAFGLRNGQPVIANQLGVRTMGYNTDLGLPISRWFNANPSGHNAGWSANLHYSIDMVPARDARRLSGVRGKSDLAAFTLNYRMFAPVTLQIEESMYRTRAANSSAGDQGGLFILRGIPSREWHDIRSELGFLFTF